MPIAVFASYGHAGLNIISFGDIIPFRGPLFGFLCPSRTLHPVDKGILYIGIIQSREGADNLIIHAITGGSSSIVWRAFNRYCTVCVHTNSEYAFSKISAAVSLP